MLKLVPTIRFGRWISACVIFIVMFAIVVFAERSLARTGFDTYRVFAWPPVLFFCAIVAYIIPVFHFITMRCEYAFDVLVPSVDLPAAQLAQMRQSVSRKPWWWHVRTIALAVFLWLLQSWLLTGGWLGMKFALTHSLLSFLMAVMPLLVWLTVTIATASLLDNARLFRGLTAHLNIDLLDPNSVTPVGMMAVHSTLVVIGAQALFPIMWISGPIDAWTTLPGVFLLSIVVVALLVLPLWPVRKKLHRLKAEELAGVQQALNARRQECGGDVARHDEVLGRLLAYRREIESISEWPVDFGALARLLSYVVIVPLTWIGAAVIETVVGRLLG